MTAQQAVAFVTRRLAKHADPQRAAHELVQQALRLHTTDNVSALVLCLNQIPITRAEADSLATTPHADADAEDSDEELALSIQLQPPPSALACPQTVSKSSSRESRVLRSSEADEDEVVESEDALDDF
jgi:hypothetical protein